MKSSEPDRRTLDLHADNVRLQLENEDLRFQLSRLENEVEALRDALDLVSREK